MGQGMKDTGEMICKRDKELRYGVMEHNIQGIIKKGKSTDMECINGLMDQGTKETGLIIKSKVLAYIHGQMEDSMKDTGKIIICMDKVFILGRTVESMMAIITWIRSMVTESISGLMVENTRVSGQMENKTEKESTHLQMEKLEGVSGMMERELNGQMNLRGSKLLVEAIVEEKIKEVSVLFLKIT